MNVDTEITIPCLGDIVPAVRARLVRYCAHFTGEPGVAEDLAQQALLEAWQGEHKLHDPKMYERWLFGVARNICLRWMRRRARDTSRLMSLHDDSNEIGAGPEAWLADEADLEVELERDELARLLDRAMGLLPEATRSVLVERYIEESPQAEVAARLGLSEGAVEARLHRGKLALHRVLTTQFRNEAASYGLVDSDHGGWQETRIWCPGCGRHRLLGALYPEAGELSLRCPVCCCERGGYNSVTTSPGLFDGLKGYKPAMSRMMASVHRYYRPTLATGTASCRGCGRPTRLRFGSPNYIEPWRATPYAVYVKCEYCGAISDCTLMGLALSVPQTRRFWREHPKMRVLPEREVDVQGTPALVTTFESVTGMGRLDLISARDTFQLIGVHGTLDE